jgi:hypothetical protein
VSEGYNVVRRKVTGDLDPETTAKLRGTWLDAERGQPKALVKDDRAKGMARMYGLGCILFDIEAYKFRTYSTAG